MSVRLEHANLSVRDVEEMLRFLRTAFPEFRVRGEGKNPRGLRWVHLGTDETYIALNEVTMPPPTTRTLYGDTPGVNHLAYEVDDVEALRHRLAAAGYQDSTVPNAHPYRKRVYFNDREGNDWEFVEYLSDDPSKRHDYKLPDQ